MDLLFEWDPVKAQRNIIVHGISFDEASTVFRDPLSKTIDDPLHSMGENRYVIIGQSLYEKLLIVVHTERNDIIRIISARQATPKERRFYETNEE